MTDIYNLHDKAFSSVSAYVILKGGERVATVAFKFPKDGAGRLYAYVHWIGARMVRGNANGYGYDKKSAAVEDAVRNLTHTGKGDAEELCEFSAMLQNIAGNTWDRVLVEAGYQVLQAV